MTWIKCSEQVPPCGWHLAYSPLHGIMLSRQRVLVIDAFGRQTECTEAGVEITHWMPMPEPPGAENQRKVKLPRTFLGILAMADGDYQTYMLADDVLAALKAAGVECLKIPGEIEAALAGVEVKP